MNSPEEDFQFFKEIPFFQNSPRNGVRKDLLALLSQKNTKEETDFLKKLVNFMERRNTPIERPPMLGYKQSMKIAPPSIFLEFNIFVISKLAEKFYFVD